MNLISEPPWGHYYQNEKLKLALERWSTLCKCKMSAQYVFMFRLLMVTLIEIAWHIQTSLVFKICQYNLSNSWGKKIQALFQYITCNRPVKISQA
ncbi:hypothetical protein GDO86_006272 [Hymenochirus boettgeri]|uniref:Uncharacterized protein n=1 Tax=Hymenochirus boettgeri TaxID=247094 RepID=A0A8T2JAE7_9PIPI|nr:hypothetical protein GDO86_006272 [Hymenochirus boettgeri]